MRSLRSRSRASGREGVSPCPHHAKASITALAPHDRDLVLVSEIEAARELPADLVMELANARLFKVAVSEEEGGLGADILTTLRVIEEVARADGSTGWCLAMGINTFRQSAQLAPEVRREIFHSDPVGVSAGSANPRGRAVAVPGGYRVTGHWFFASGCMHSSLLHGACKVFDGEAPRLRPNGDQDVRIAYFSPKSLARIIDTWNVSGMRGTGSHDIEVDDVFVPEEYTFSALDRRARVTGPMNRMHGFDLAGCGFCCVGLGVARAAVDAFVELAQVKIPRSSSELLRERVMVQAQVGEAEAVLRQGVGILDRQTERGGRFPAKGLHWLLGMIRLARRDAEEALLAFDREIGSDPNQLYAREFAMNASDARGLVLLGRGVEFELSGHALSSSVDKVQPYRSAEGRPRPW
jgi:alkylation response protein AidB-like acyl-CoA dehydrogenase